MAVPSESELVSSPEFQALPPPIQAQAIATYRQRFAAPAAAEEQEGGAPVADQEDQAAEQAAVEPAPAAVTTKTAAKPPFAWAKMADHPGFKSLSRQSQDELKQEYYERFEKPLGISRNDSQTSPGMAERALGGARGVIGSFQKTLGLFAGQPEWVKAGQENERVSQQTSYDLPNPSEGWEQVKNLGSLDFYKQVLTHYLPAAMPYIAGAVAGGQAGALAGAAVGAPTGPGEAVTIPAGALLGAMIGLFGVGFTQTYGDAHQEYLDKHPGDFDGANDYGMKQAGISGAVAMAAEPLSLVGGGAAVPAIARGMTGAAVPIVKEAAAAPLKRALGQLIIQSTTGVGGQVLGNAVRQGQDPSASLTDGLAQAGLSQLAFALPGIVRASRVAKGAMVHSLGSAEESAKAAGKDKGPEGGILDKVQWDPSTGMQIPEHGYYPEPPPPIIDPSTGMEVSQHAEIPVQGREVWQEQPFAKGYEPERPAPIIGEEEVPVAPDYSLANPPASMIAESKDLPHGWEEEPFARMPREAQRPAEEQPSTEVPKPEGVPFMITKLMKARLKSEGYSDAEIGTMKPADAFEIIRSREEERQNPEKMQDVPPGTQEPAAPEPTPNAEAAATASSPTAEAQRTPLKERQEPEKVPPETEPKNAYDITDYLQRLEKRKPGTIERYQKTLARRGQAGPLAPEEAPETGLKPGEEAILTGGTDAEKAALATVAGSRQRIAKRAQASLAPTGGEPVQPGTLEALQARAKAMFGDRGPLVELSQRLTNGAAGEMDAAARVIRVAHDAVDKAGTLDHEGWHWAKEFLLNPLEKRVVEGKFRENSQFSKRVAAQLSGSANERARGQLISGDEREAHGFQLWQQGKLKADTSLGRIFDKISEQFERVRNWVAGSGFKSAEDVFRSVSKGDLVGRQDTGGGMRQSAPAGVRSSLGPTASQIREPFRRRVEATGQTAEQKVDQVADALTRLGPSDPYTKGVNTHVLNMDANAKNHLAATIAQNQGPYMEKASGGTQTWRENYAGAEKILRAAEYTDSAGNKFKGPQAYLRTVLEEKGRKAVDTKNAIARRILLDASASHVIDSRGDRYGTVEQRRNWTFALAQHELLQAKVMGSESEIARALQSIQSIPKMQSLKGIALAKDLERFHAGKYDALSLGDAMDAYDDPAKIKSFLQDVWKPKWHDYPKEVWMNGLLSNPAILFKKTITDGLLRAAMGPEDVVASLFGRMRGAQDRVYAGEALARWRSQITSSVDAFTAAKQMFKNGQGNFVENAPRHAFQGKIGDIVRLPSRAIEAVNEFAQVKAYAETVQALAHRTAIREGLTGQAYEARYADLVAHPSEAIKMEALDASKYLTAQKELGDFGKRLQGLVNSTPLLKVVMPFVKTPINLLKLGIERSPLAPALGEVRDAIAAGGIARDKALARMSIGTAGAVALASLAKQGLITGDGPTDPQAMAVKRRTGPQGGERWQPRSLLIGGRYYSYGNIEPLGILLGSVASFVELHDQMQGMEADKAAGAIVGSIAKTIVSRTYLQGLSDLIGALSDPERHGQSYIGRMAGSLVPSGVAQTNRMLDPDLRETQGIFDQVKARIPGLAQTMPVRRDVAGEPITLGGTMGNIPYFPVFTSHQAADEVANKLESVGAKLKPVERKINRWDLTAEQHAEYAQLAGERLWPMLERVTSQSAFDNYPQDAQLRIIRRVEEMAHRTATLQMKQKYPELRRPPARAS